MPIIGTVSASPADFSFEKLKVGDRAYLHVDFIIITRRAIFIDIISEVILEEEFDIEESEEGVHLLVIRKGPGLTENDFDIIFQPNVVYDLIIECNAIYHDCIKRKDEYVIFTDFNIVDLIQVDIDVKNETLEHKLAEALRNEDYTLAGEIQKQIEKQKNT